MNRIFVRRSGVTAPWWLRRGRLGVWYRAEVALTSVRLLGSSAKGSRLACGTRSFEGQTLSSVGPPNAKWIRHQPANTREHHERGT
jgi:hypothetical protein